MNEELVLVIKRRLEDSIHLSLHNLRDLDAIDQKDIIEITAMLRKAIRHIEERRESEEEKTQIKEFERIL